jgi:hypothetical protein
VVCSPLALRTLLDAQASAAQAASHFVERGAGLICMRGGGQPEHQRGLDFLSSIEVLIMDQADVFSMQNWAHVEASADVRRQYPAARRRARLRERCLMRWTAGRR